MFNILKRKPKATRPLSDILREYRKSRQNFLKGYNGKSLLDAQLSAELVRFTLADMDYVIRVAINLAKKLEAKNESTT